MSSERGITRSAAILVVDDEAPQRHLLRALLESQEYNVVEAENGHQALGILHHENVGLVLLDMMMAGLDGSEVCALVRAEASRPYLPIIMVSGLEDRASRIRAKEAGADDYLVKPIDTLELLIRVDALYRNRETLEAFSHTTERLTRELESARERLASARELVSAAAAAARELAPLRDGLRALKLQSEQAPPSEGVDWESVDQRLTLLEQRIRALGDEEARPPLAPSAH